MSNKRPLIMRHKYPLVLSPSKDARDMRSVDTASTPGQLRRASFDGLRMSGVGLDRLPVLMPGTKSSSTKSDRQVREMGKLSPDL
ncbi:hypothetical protein, partial [Telmatospirillum sp.]|uniref:hypothetical protein n=1 Tax=Telmatospirillum sp. TaxID=2079197 RepID=UPI00284DD672